jgi:DNA topoisomerase-1
MAKKLVIVESPAKAKTIEKFLGHDFTVLASMGHIVDLPKKGLGVNTRKDFAPRYEVIEKKDKLIDELRNASKHADEVYLAPDPDREGEFIAWSLKNTLGLENPHRAVFHEITKKAVQEAIRQPRVIDEDLFNAQQARRVLDRLVGYKISPLLWRRVQSGTSAGRVQSVALRLICDREAEIRAFVPEEYWSITATLSKQKQAERFEATLISRLKDLNKNEEAVPAVAEEPAVAGMRDENGKNGRGALPKGRIKVSSKEEADAILRDLQGAAYSILKYEQREQRRQPPLPYTTSTMQQDSSLRLYYKPKKTMSLAQQLYEGIALGNRGQQGLITYMRTDSTRISDEAQVNVKAFIKDKFGQPYVGSGRTSKAKANTQDAHEAIRPTDATLTPDIVKPYLSADQFKLYNLIWRRFVASFMTAAVFDVVRVDIVANQYVFRANGSNLKFQGFYAVWFHEDDERLLPLMQVNEVLENHGLKPQQHFTQPPPRFSEASLIKELEERGIGRPSTYVPIISTIQDRGYADQDQRRFSPTWLGETVNELMNKHFPDIVDIGFTAEMERKLDEVEEGRRAWTEFLRDFYGDFKTKMEKAEAEMDRVQKPLEEMDELCPDCGRNLVIRSGRFGRFVSCSGFPDCRYRRSLVNKTGALCPQCGHDLVERKTRQKKRIFYGCSNYPTCNFAIWEKPSPDPCPSCGGLLVIPKPGQDPVCYQEVIALQAQRGSNEKPHQDGGKKTTTRRTTNKTPLPTTDVPVEDSGVEVDLSREQPEEVAATPKTRRVSTTRKKATTESEPTETAAKTTGTRKKTSTTAKSAAVTVEGEPTETVVKTTSVRKRTSTTAKSTTRKTAATSKAGKSPTSKTTKSVASKSATASGKATKSPAKSTRKSVATATAEKSTTSKSTGKRAVASTGAGTGSTRSRTKSSTLPATAAVSRSRARTTE